MVTLSQDGRPAGPLSAALAGVLEDPTLQVVTKLPGEGWRDDAGQPISAPQTLKDATVADVPGGGILALLHGPGPRADIDVCTAAARAAVLALQRVRITTEMHRQINQVRESGVRLLDVDREEREALAGRLQSGARDRLARVRDLLDRIDPLASGSIAVRLGQVDDDLDRLARGLLPAALGRPLADALELLSAGLGMQVEIEVNGATDQLTDQLKSFVYFLVSEALTNVVKHSGAGHAWVRITLDGTVRVEIRDDGHGGAMATVGHGLQGLADRVTLADGTLTIDSPLGGPTTLVAEVPTRG